MGRTSKSNPRYRTKSELCDDIAFVLNSSLHYGTKYAVFDNAMWDWTQFEGKYKGCECWSEESSPKSSVVSFSSGGGCPGLGVGVV